MGNKGWIIVSATLAVVTAISVARGFPSGPSVSTGSNPIKYFQYVDQPCVAIPAAKGPPFCTSISKKKQIFEVPAGQTLIITDLHARATWPVSGVPLQGNTHDGSACQVCVLADGNGVWCTQVGGAANIESPSTQWSTGIAIASGAKLELLLSNDAGVYGADATCVAVATGYLMRN